MPIVTEITALGKLLLDAFNAIRGIIREKASDKKKLFNPELLADMHLFLTRLQTDVKKLIHALERSKRNEVKQVWKDFSQDLLDFSKRFQALNLGVIEIYHPGLGANLARAYGMDSTVYSYFGRFALDTLVCPRDISKQQQHFLEINEQFDKLGLLDRQRNDAKDAIEVVQTKNECKAQLELLATTLKECAELVGMFMKNNWTPKDLS